jgi:hypothetical protein
VIRELRRQGLSISEISRQAGHDRRTIRKMPDEPRHPAPYERRKRGSNLDPYKPYLRRQMAAGVLNADGPRHALPMDVPVIATPTLVVWETEDAFRVAVQVNGQNSAAGVWGAAEQPKCRQLLTLQPDNGFLLIKQEHHDRAALARCVRLATQNAYFSLRSHLVNDNGRKAATAEGVTSG